MRIPRVSHTIHVWYIFTYIWLIFMVNVGKWMVWVCHLTCLTRSLRSLTSPFSAWSRHLLFRNSLMVEGHETPHRPPVAGWESQRKHIDTHNNTKHQRQMVKYPENFRKFPLLFTSIWGDYSAKTLPTKKIFAPRPQKWMAHTDC